MRGAILHARVAEPARGGAVLLRRLALARADDALQLDARRDGVAEHLLGDLRDELVRRVLALDVRARAARGGAVLLDDREVALARRAQLGAAAVRERELGGERRDDVGRRVLALAR